MIDLKVNNKKCRYKKNTSLIEIAKDFPSQYPIVAAIVNNEIKELHTIPEDFSVITFINSTHKDGWSILRRSLTFLFVKACHDVLDHPSINIIHSLNKGIYCEVEHPKNISANDVNKIKEQMKSLVEKDIPFYKRKLSLADAITLFEKENQPSKVNLLKTIEKTTINTYECEGYTDHFYGFLVPSTRYLNIFDLQLMEGRNAIILLGPKRENPLEVISYVESPKLLNIYEERRDWSKLMNVNLLGDLNNIIKEGKDQELIRLMEALHENKIASIANDIAKSPQEKRIILIAGPSSSGKTSFAKRLELQLKVNGLSPVSISTDDYFVNRNLTPVDENGQKDYETIECVDRKTLNKDIESLLKGKEVLMPTYDFISGERKYLGNTLKIQHGEPIIIEGIHSLNPLLTEDIPDEVKFKIYVSPLTSLNLDDHNRIPTTDTRLIRRIVRDFQFRGHSASDTIRMWESVRRGEKQYIYPYQEFADVMFNSALTYELAVLKPYALKILSMVTSQEAEYAEAKRLIRFLEYFNDILEHKSIPSTSIIQEFLGNSSIVH